MLEEMHYAIQRLWIIHAAGPDKIQSELLKCYDAGPYQLSPV